MTSTWFLELAASLSGQVALLILATHILTRMTRDTRLACHLWSLSYVVMLGLICGALLLPHPRWLPPIWRQLSRPAVSELLLLEAAIGRAVFTFWLIGVVALWTRMIVQSLRIAQFLKKCHPIRSDHPALSECRDELLTSGDYGNVTLLSCHTLAGPFCWQFHRPYIVLPDFLLGLGPAELRFIIRHELAHLRTGHPLQVFLQRFIEIVFWFHPLVWWASRLVSRSREFACDDAAIDNPAQIANYLRTLLVVVEHGSAESDQPYPALTFGRGQQIVADRARRLASIARFGWSRRISRRAFASAAMGWLAVSVACFGLWLPIDVIASPRSTWSPWPRWSAGFLHEFGVSVRDFETYDDRIELSEILMPSKHATTTNHRDFQNNFPK